MKGAARFPLHYPLTGGGCSCRDPGCNSVGKHPLTPRGFKDATTDPATLARWEAMHPGCNWGMVTGHGVVVLDQDNRSGGEASRVALEDEFGELRTLTVRTGNGLHFYFAGDLPTRPNIRPGIDLKGRGGYVVAEGSTHANGARYERVAPDDLPTVPQPCPAWLAHLVDPPRVNVAPIGAITPAVVGNVCHGGHGARYVAAAIEAECLAVATAPEGERNHTLNVAAFAVGRFVAEGKADPVAVHDALSAAARHAGLSEREIHLTIKSGLRARRAA